MKERGKAVMEEMFQTSYMSKWVERASNASLQQLEELENIEENLRHLDESEHQVCNRM